MKETQNKAGAIGDLFVPDYLRKQLINQSNSQPVMAISRQEWLEWLVSPCTKQLMLELANERQGLVDVLIKGTKEEFDAMQGHIRQVDFVIKCINEKGG